MVKLDNSQRILRENREKTSFSYNDRVRNTSPRDDKRVRNTKRVSFAPISSTSLQRQSSPSNDARDEDIKNNAYYLYHQKGHLSKDYPKRQSRQYNPHSYERGSDPRAHNIKGLEEELDYQEASEGSENDLPLPKTRQEVRQKHCTALKRIRIRLFSPSVP